MNDKRYYQYIRGNNLFDYKDKKESVWQTTFYNLDRTLSMFEWHGLPDTIPQRMLELYLQTNGFAAVAKAGGKLYAFFGGLGGEPDAYYQPTMVTVANPYLQFSETLRISEECVLVRNDPLFMGLLPLINKYATMLAENELSMWMATVNTRIQTLLAASDDVTKESAQRYIDKLYGGDLSVISNNAFLDDLKTYQMSNSGNVQTLGQLIETEQYIKASMYNELGLNANYNMKREALNSAESSINDDILFPFVDQMLKERQEGAESINSMYGTDISVSLASSWKDNKDEEEATIDSIKDGDSDNSIKDGGNDDVV